MDTSHAARQLLCQRNPYGNHQQRDRQPAPQADPRQRAQPAVTDTHRTASALSDMSNDLATATTTTTTSPDIRCHHSDENDKKNDQQLSIESPVSGPPASQHANDTTAAPSTPYALGSQSIRSSPAYPTAICAPDAELHEQRQRPPAELCYDQPKFAHAIEALPIRRTSDIFTDTQKVAFVGLCAVISLEIVHGFRGNESAYARMSADNWRRKLMHAIYKQMDTLANEINMIEDLFKHGIQPDDLVREFVAQGETATVQVGAQPKDDDDAGSTCSWTPPFSPCISSASATCSSKSGLISPIQTPGHSGDDGSQQQQQNDVVELDLRWTAVCNLLVLFLSTESFDARTRVFLSRMASYLQLDSREMLSMELSIARHLLEQQQEQQEQPVRNGSAYRATRQEEHMAQLSTERRADLLALLPISNANEKQYRNRERRKRRYTMVGLATIGGGLILGVSAGLMAPLIAGGIGTILSTVGVSGAGSFLGSTAGIAMITGSMTSIGGGIGAKSMTKRMKTINTFEFQPVAVNGHPGSIISVSGWLPKRSDRNSAAALPFSTLDSLVGDHYALHWEPEMLQDLGSAFKIFATEVVTFSIQQALTHTIMGALLTGLAWPLALTKLGYLVDNPWHNGLDRARLAGLILADALMNRNLGARPVSLVGYSLGARVIFYCLLELARVNAHGLIENVALFGTPVSASKSDWEACISVVAGRFVNGYAKNDWLLGFLFRASTAGLGNVAGLRPLLSVDHVRVQNIDCTDLLNGHLSYRTCMPKLLERAGFLVTSDELPERVKANEEEDGSSTQVALDLSGAKELEHFRPSSKTNRHSFVSSLSAGKASIQYPPPKTKCIPHPPPLVQTTVPSTPPPLLSGQSTPSVHEDDPNSPTVFDSMMISDIIAQAEAASKCPGKYSSLMLGRASITLETCHSPFARNNRPRSLPASIGKNSSVSA